MNRGLVCVCPSRQSRPRTLRILMGRFYADHAQFHLAYFRRNLDAFRAAST
jgi:hypothetical protein